jgi:hypothetical protein
MHWVITPAGSWINLAQAREIETLQRDGVWGIYVIFDIIETADEGALSTIKIERCWRERFETQEDARKWLLESLPKRA